MKTEQVAELYSQLQQSICRTLEIADGKGKFIENEWHREIGGGLTNVMQHGAIIEKAGVNFSYVRGKFTPTMERLLGEKADAYAVAGISSIIHAANPFVPTIHMNVRYFSLDSGVAWFGGGIDLTPTYINLAEARWFHESIKEICDSYGDSFYADWKAWADDYFYLPHRQETRGVGGIFFDRVKPETDDDFEMMLSLTADLANAYPVIYGKLMHDNASKEFTPEQKHWQKLRRGRYVEFNLIYDRGTRFGLESGGNTESILVSLPAEVEWAYNYHPAKGSPEFQTQELLKKGIDWVNFEGLKH